MTPPVYRGSCLCGATAFEVHGPFCAQCGSTLFWQADASPARISIAAGCLDGATGLSTEGHIFCAHKGDYYMIPAEGYRRDGWE